MPEVLTTYRHKDRGRVTSSPVGLVIKKTEDLLLKMDIERTSCQSRTYRHKDRGRVTSSPVGLVIKKTEDLFLLKMDIERKICPSK